jgi:DNA adenine methylase
MKNRVVRGSRKPIFRWAGSKRKLLPTLRQYIPSFVRYVEPFAGSACLFFDLLPPRALLGDVNHELIETYTAVRSAPLRVGELVAAMPVSKVFYYELRGKDPEAMSVVERAARFVYLNRFCFNGVYRTNRSGKFNVPRGVRTGSLPTIADLDAWSRILNCATLVQGDFEKCLSKVRSGDFVYLDPPYAEEGSRDRGEYGYPRFLESDFERVLECLKRIDKIGAKFLLSYRYSKEIRDALSAWNVRTVLVKRHVAGFIAHRSLVREILASNVPFEKRFCR